MSRPASVRVSIDVAIDRDDAFRVFTSEIDAWYRRGSHSFAEPDRAVAIRFEPRVGGRLLEVHDLASGTGREMGRIRVWEPGKRLLFIDSRGTEVDVRFEPNGDGTRVTLEHRGLERLAPELAERHARFGWRLIFVWYEEHLRAAEAG